ncbi:Protein adenylyltransferase SelO-1 [Acropora cervicornis]|uniref:Selenoprotein O n=1 Tax=Acropora cervicornis TaxID=6130 RepID=A0AAD9QZ57_ACRCE|nr:Protein adenylyltransferase SelO-1 [Acropora cervicornis]
MSHFSWSRKIFPWHFVLKSNLAFTRKPSRFPSKQCCVNYFCAGLEQSTNYDSKMATLETLNFDNLALRSLPIDKELDNYVRQVSGVCFSRVQPTPVNSAKTVVYSSQAMSLLDLTEEELNRADFAEYFSGNKLLPGAEPAAHCYCGHQFGYFSGQLGDGAGLTPFSRQADGRKVLRSSIREFLCSEAMHFLGVPTTRAGSCVTSDSKIIRDIFYNGNAIREKCTVVLRIAPTFIRFGSFEIFKPIDSMTGRRGPSAGRTDIMVQLLDYTVNTFFPECAQYR